MKAEHLTQFQKTLGLLTIICFLGLLLEVFLLNSEDKVDVPFIQSDWEVETNALLEKLGNRKLLTTEKLIQAPLFIEGRRQINIPVEANEKSQKKRVNNNLHAKLLGISFSQSPPESLALILDNKGKYLRLHTGEKFQGWVLKVVNKANVLFVKGNEKIELFLEKHKTSQNRSPTLPTHTPKGVGSPRLMKAIGNKKAKR